MQIMNLCNLQNRFNLFNPFMRTINLIVIHCSATREDKSFTEYDLDVCHRRRGFNGTGYHFYIRKNGDIKSTRPIEKDRCALPRFQQGKYRYLLRRRTRLHGTTEGHTHLLAKTLSACINSHFIERVSRLPDMWTPGS